MVIFRKYSKFLTLFIPIIFIFPIIASAHAVRCEEGCSCKYMDCSACNRINALFQDSTDSASIRCKCKTTDNSLNKESLLVSFKTTGKQVISIVLKNVDYNYCISSYNKTFLTSTNLKLSGHSLFTFNSSLLL